MNSLLLLFDNILLLLQRLGRIGAHEAEGLEGDGGEGHEQDYGQCGKVDDRGVHDADRIGLEPSAKVCIGQWHGNGRTDQDWCDEAPYRLPENISARDSEYL